MTTKYPFEVSYDAVAQHTDAYVDAIFNSLQSSFLILPKGPGFVTYTDFEEAYEILKQCTNGFANTAPEAVMRALERDALSFVVVRAILGFSPPELADIAVERSGARISQSYVRTLDRNVRDRRDFLSTCSRLQRERIETLIDTACHLIEQGAPEVPDDMIHRLDKADTRRGPQSIQHLADEGAPYAMLLYERFLGRSFAAHRDAVSGLVGQVMEDAVESQLRAHRVSYRRTQRAESIEGFDQVPDFVIPDEWNPRIVIEAKIAGDDGTARDKVTRIQHLAAISRMRGAQGLSPFQVVACIDGRGFGVRREDMRKLLQATKGKVFTTETLEQLVPCTNLRDYASR